MGIVKYTWLRNASVWACVLLLCGSYVHCCGPGRSGGRRRSPRKLTPLVFKQHIPNVAENTLGASGLTEGRITKDDPRFHDLVPNYNPDIYFRDDEGTGADRLMTERCKEKLNMLAIIVMNQWPGIRLRVVEGWDEEQHHTKQSLHYEGRAVDLSTSDKDRSKLGMLGRLAVESGFDWVYYESRNFIHCSVKSETSSSSKLGGCFPRNGRVLTPSGKKELSTVQEGDMVQVLKIDGTLMFSPVIMFLHKDSASSRIFLTLNTSSGESISLTASHLLLALSLNDAPYAAPTTEHLLQHGSVVMAGTIQVGDYLLTVSENNSTVVDKVTSVSVIHSTGVYAPLTYEGTVVVDNIVASCYAVINSQDIAHWAFLPVRAYNHVKDFIWNILNGINIVSTNTNYPDIKNITKKSFVTKTEYLKTLKNNEESHIHWYPKLLYKIASWVLPGLLVHS